MTLCIKLTAKRKKKKERKERKWRFWCITTTDTSTGKNGRPSYTHWIQQRNDNLKEANKITKNVNRGNGIRVRNEKQRSQPQNYNNISQQGPNLHEKTTDLREIKKKSNNILFLTDSMLKMLHMGEYKQLFFQSKNKIT